MSNLLFLPTIPASLSSATHDPYWADVTMLAHFDNNFTNSSPNGAAGFTQFTAPNQCTSSSVQSKFGGFSCLSASATHGCFANGAGYSFGTADYTVEFWLYLSDVTTGQNILDFRTGSNQPTPVVYVLTGTVRVFIANADRVTSGAAAIAVNTWTAISWARVGGTTRLFIGGVQAGSNYADANNSASAQITVGSFNGSGCISNGYMDELRVTKGVGRYAANYTVQTAAWPNG